MPLEDTSDSGEHMDGFSNSRANGRYYDVGGRPGPNPSVQVGAYGCDCKAVENSLSPLGDLGALDDVIHLILMSRGVGFSWGERGFLEDCISDEDVSVSVDLTRCWLDLALGLGSPLSVDLTSMLSLCEG